MSLVETVKSAGIIGCGGAGFPTHVKIDTKVDVVIANGAECEPLLNTDQRVMETYADELVLGLLLIVKNVGAKQAYIAVKEGYERSIAALSARVAKVDNLELALLGNFYPAGDEQILLTEITDKIVPEGGIPLDVGAVVSNVLTMVQVARASAGRPVTEREVTLVGEVRKPQVITAPIGTPVADLLQVARPRIPVEEMAVIDGGPMMGRIVGTDSAVNKTTSGFIFLSKEHPLIQWRTIPMSAMIRRSVAACCQCRECTEICSRFMQGHRIEPHLMMRSLAYHSDPSRASGSFKRPNDEPTRAMTGAFLCSQCGLCEFACPMNLSPRRAFVDILERFRASGFRNPHRSAPEAPHEFRRYRKIGKDRLTRRYLLTDYESHDLVLGGMSDPPAVRLSLTQAAGVPPEPVVEVGSSVSKGDLVARAPKGKLGANLHASISGKVAGIDSEAIVIEG